MKKYVEKVNQINFLSYIHKLVDDVSISQDKRDNKIVIESYLVLMDC
jgi:hypothetical protein